MSTLHIKQEDLNGNGYRIQLILTREGSAPQTGEADIQFALTEQEQRDLRWYLEDYLLKADVVEAVTVQQIELMMKARGEELYRKILDANGNTRALWFRVRDELPKLRIEISTGIVEAASIPWELLRDPEMDSPVCVRAKSFVRVQSNPNIEFIRVPPPAKDGRVRLLYIVCRPGGANDVELRAVANRLLQDLGADRARFDIKALRPPTYEQLQLELQAAVDRKQPYHIVHFDGHGGYGDLSSTALSGWLSTLSPLMLSGAAIGKHGYLFFEHSGEEKTRPVDGHSLGKLLHDKQVPILVLNACQSAMHEATAAPATAGAVHDEVRAIGSLAQSVANQGIPAVLAMRYSVFVVTAAQYISRVYSRLARGDCFGEAATEGRKDLEANRLRPIGLTPHPLQDWLVPVVIEAQRIELFHGGAPPKLGEIPELDPLQINRALRRYVPEEGFIGRDETLLALDRAFDAHRIVLLHAYAGQGKTSAAVEFARWYSLTGGLGAQPVVLLATFERHTDLADLLNQIGQTFAGVLGSNGFDWSATNDPEKRRKLVLSILRTIPILWIWDNVEPIAGFPEGAPSNWTDAEQADLHDFLQQIKLDSANQVKILLTSRREERGWLGGIPHRIQMRRMTDSDAAKLALKLGEEKGLKPSDVAQWQRLLRYCAGNPLTLRVLVGQAVRQGLRTGEQIETFVEEIRSGEQKIQDADATQGRDRSLGASLDYGFKHAFQEDELPVIALLHLFQGTVDVGVLATMGILDAALPELQGKSKEHLAELLRRAKETGLLTHLAHTWFTVHPALPWFLSQIFARHYDGQSGRSTANAALGAWAESMGFLGDYYHRQFNEGIQGVVRLLELEEANLLHARRVALRNGWWSRVTSCMQGILNLYDYQGRGTEWARLVEEIRADFCSADDGPIAGREDDYSVVIQYRVWLAQDYEHDLDKAARLQKKRVDFDRFRAADVVALPLDSPLNADQRNRLRNLGVTLQLLGNILSEKGDPACVQRLNESLGIAKRIGDRRGQATVETHLGDAFASLRDLDAAEASYQRGFDLLAATDIQKRVGITRQIGMVHYERFKSAWLSKEPAVAILAHWQAAESHYLKALELCPKDAWSDLAPIHNSLGNLYSMVGQEEAAIKHFELDADCEEKSGNRFGAGQTRINRAIMYIKSADRQSDLIRRRATFNQAKAYAEAALRDFRHYQGRASREEAKAQALLDLINQKLSDPPNV